MPEAIPPSRRPGCPVRAPGKLGPRQIALALCLQSAAFTSLLPKARPYPKSLEPPLKSCLKEKGGETRCCSPAGTAGIPVLPQELEPSPRDLFPEPGRHPLPAPSPSARPGSVGFGSLPPRPLRSTPDSSLTPLELQGLKDPVGGRELLLRITVAWKPSSTQAANRGRVQMCGLLGWEWQGKGSWAIA